MLFELSGRLFVGACSKTVRPCSSRLTCGVQVLSRGHLVWNDWGWTGWGWDGGIDCGCTPLDRVLLSGYPVREITEVLIDGDVVDPNTYRLDGWRYLVRTNGFSWPTCQALELDDTEDGTFSRHLPVWAGSAAGRFSCGGTAWLRNLQGVYGGGDCALPSGTTRVGRQGVMIERLAFAAWGLQKNVVTGIWRTGLTLVDTFLNSCQQRHI